MRNYEALAAQLSEKLELYTQELNADLDSRDAAMAEIRATIRDMREILLNE